MSIPFTPFNVLAAEHIDTITQSLDDISMRCREAILQFMPAREYDHLVGNLADIRRAVEELDVLFPAPVSTVETPSLGDTMRDMTTDELMSVATELVRVSREAQMFASAEVVVEF